MTEAAPSSPPSQQCLPGGVLILAAWETEAQAEVVRLRVTLLQNCIFTPSPGQPDDLTRVKSPDLGLAPTEPGRFLDGPLHPSLPQ